ncbi:MAG: hypothetical protein QM811_24445 [Pirellulales bacterium]
MTARQERGATQFGGQAARTSATAFWLGAIHKPAPGGCAAMVRTYSRSMAADLPLRAGPVSRMGGKRVRSWECGVTNGSRLILAFWSDREPCRRKQFARNSVIVAGKSLHVRQECAV